jgi:ferritin-like metal-binding protein YciE
MERMMAKPEDLLMHWLRDAHAMEVQAATMLEGMARRIKHYPQLRETIERHLEETRKQAELVEGCIKRRGGDTSVLKDLAGRVVGMGQALSGVVMGDEIVKGAMAGYTFEHLEISAYKCLIATAEEVGDTETARVCRQILQQEEEMALWMGDHLDQVPRQYLSRAEAELTAQR